MKARAAPCENMKMDCVFPRLQYSMIVSPEFRVTLSGLRAQTLAGMYVNRGSQESVT